MMLKVQYEEIDQVISYQDKSWRWQWNTEIQIMQFKISTTMKCNTMWVHFSFVKFGVW